MTAPDAHRAIDAVWRIEGPRLIARLARMTGDVGRAEDLAQDALVVAMEHWPRTGIPDNPGAWLMTTAKHRAIDAMRRDDRLREKQQVMARDLEGRGDMAPPGVDAAIDDDLLRLIFTCCHPVLKTEARVALTLRLVGGLTTDEIARAFLTPEPTLAQRIVRAKRTLTEAGVEIEVPGPDELEERLASVLEVLYLIFNEGYAATAGDDWMRPELCADALRMGRVLAALMPREPEVHGLVALMEIQASRTGARTAPGGAPILLLDQDRGRWNRLLIGRGLDALARAEELGGTGGFYALQAAIAACHARAPTADATDWVRMEALYRQLAALTGSAVVELNRAVALGMADGPAAGLALVDALAEDGELAGYHLLPSVRGDLLARLGRGEEARAEFERAAGLTHNERERAVLLARAAEAGAA